MDLVHEVRIFFQALLEITRRAMIQFANFVLGNRLLTTLQSKYYCMPQACFQIKIWGVKKMLLFLHSIKEHRNRMRIISTLLL